MPARRFCGVRVGRVVLIKARTSNRTGSRDQQHINFHNNNSNCPLHHRHPSQRPQNLIERRIEKGTRIAVRLMIRATTYPMKMWMISSSEGGQEEFLDLT